jgi:glutathione S-transferase
MRFYYSPGACSLAVHLALEQAGAPYEAVSVPTTQGAQREPAYTAINPLGRLPALVVDDTVLTETLALLLYVDATHPQARLMPTTPLRRAALTALMAYLASTLHIHYAGRWRPERFTDGSAAQEQLRSDALQRLAQAHDHLETLLPEQGWLGGEHVSLADFYLLPFWRWALRLQLPTARWPRQAGVVRQLMALPATPRVLAREGIPMPPFENFPGWSPAP